MVSATSKMPQGVIAALLLLLCALATSTSPPPPSTDGAGQLALADNATAGTNSSFNCAEGCQCTVAQHTHKPTLHAKCTSVEGLKALPQRVTLPIHSIDLSHLNLPRLAHLLEPLHDLTSIDLSHNELHEIGHLGRRIKKLNLKHNRLTSGKLAKLPQHVQVLNLQHNDITYLPLELTKLMQLQTLELSRNEINCSCETLEVRNWLQERHVFMEHPVKCSHPPEAKGKSWLQLKQSDICEKEKGTVAVAGDEGENELMMGDQPVEGSADLNEDEEDEEEEELGKAFMPIDKKASTPHAHAHDSIADDVEGSGDLSEAHMSLDLLPTTQGPPMMLARAEGDGSTAMPAEDEVDDEEGSGGSGGGILFIPRGPVVTDDFEAPATNDDDDDLDNRPIEQPIFHVHMGIYDGHNEGTSDAPVIEEPIVPVVHMASGADNTPDDDVATDSPSAGGSDEEQSQDILHAKVGDQEDSNATYLLMGVIVLIVVGLLFYVGIKRCKRNREANADAENPRQTELLDMDKKHPGKPVHFNGQEHAPLIGEKSKVDQAKPLNGAGKKPYESNDIKDGPTQQQQPLLNGSQNAAANNGAPNESNNNHDGLPTINEPGTDQAPHAYFPITPRYPTPKSPRASKYAQHTPGENNNNHAEDAYLPSSPKSGRYSPVYSPETGRVKIKLTETPKPKTPMLVTRSKSNAGEIITTPVHVAPVGGAANGHVDH